MAVRALAWTCAIGSSLVAVGGGTVLVIRAHPARMMAQASTAVTTMRTHVRDLFGELTGDADQKAETRVAREEAGRLLLPVAPPLAAPPAPALPPTPPLLPIVAQGATHLRDSVIAVRSGDSVVVHFDTPRTRTRRPEKFEQIVRSTLPAIYGPAVDSVLDRIPSGDLARQGDLLTDLATHGLKLSLGDGWDLALWPETRRGQDGPLVVMYRALVTRE